MKAFKPTKQNFVEKNIYKNNQFFLVGGNGKEFVKILRRDSGYCVPSLLKPFFCWASGGLHGGGAAPLPTP